MKMKRIGTWAVAGFLFAFLILGSGFSADVAKAQDKYMSQPGWSPGLFIRLRGLYVSPDAGANNPTAGGAPIVADVDIDNSVVPELDLTWFFTPNFAAELILAVTPHDIDGTGVLAGNIGDAWLLPPTLLAQYHFNPGGKMKPYLGAGLNYTVFFNEDDSGQLLPNAGLTVNSMNLDNNFGFALQAGVDIQVGQNLYLNLDVKKLWLETDATVGTTAGVPVRAKVDIDPWIFGVGFGWKFGG